MSKFDFHAMADRCEAKTQRERNVLARIVNSCTDADELQEKARSLYAQELTPAEAKAVIDEIDNYDPTPY